MRSSFNENISENIFDLITRSRMRTRDQVFPQVTEFQRCCHRWFAVVQLLSRVRLCATPWTVAHQAPLSIGLPRQEHWSGWPFPSPGDLPDLGIKPESPASAARFFTTEPSGNGKRDHPLSQM